MRVVCRQRMLAAACALLAACAGDQGGVAVLPDSTSTLDSRVTIVAHDTDTDVLTFLASDGSIAGSVPAPDGFVPVRPVHSTPFVYGAPLDGSISVVDAGSMRLHTHTIPSGLDSAVEVDGSRVLLFGGITTVGAGDVVLLELSDGTTTSFRKLLGRADAMWGRAREFTDVIVIDDLETIRSLVVPRDDPLSAWEVDAIVTGQVGETLVGISPGSATGSVVVSAFHGESPVDASDALARLDPISTATALAVSPEAVIVVGRDGGLDEIDLASGKVDHLGDLGFMPDFVRELGPNLALAANGSVGETGDIVVRLEPFEPVDIGGGGPFFGYGRAERCALVEQRAKTFVGSKSFVIRLETGRVIAELGPEPMSLAEDGCSAVDSLGKVLVIDGAVVDLDGGWFYDASADLASLIVRGEGGIIRRLDLATMTGVELPVANNYFFVEL